MFLQVLLNKIVKVKVADTNAATLLNNSNNIPAANNVSVTSATRLYDDSSFVVPTDLKGTTVTYSHDKIKQNTTTEPIKFHHYKRK